MLVAGGSLLIARAPRAGAEPTTTTTEATTTTTVAPTQIDWDGLYGTDQFEAASMLLLFGAGALTGTALWGRAA